jgi:hypothetical protein
MMGEPKYIQKPDDHFAGTYCVVSLEFPLRWILGLKIPCDSNTFPNGILEIPVDSINAAKNPQWVVVDVGEPGVQPSFNTREAKIIGQAVFRDAAPWLFITLLDKIK